MMEVPHKKWLQYCIMLFAPLLTVIDVFIVNIAIPSIKDGLHATDGKMELVIASYLLGYASFQITGGRAGDHFGRKKTFMWGMILFVIASCLCGLATNSYMLIIARLVQGISGAFMTPQALSFVQLLFPEAKERTKAIGFLGITLGVASMTGQFLGGYFSDMKNLFIMGWRFIFFINLPIGLFALWAAHKYVKEISLLKEGGFDIGGVVLVTLSLACLIYPLSEGREAGWPWWSLVMISIAVLLFWLFVRNQQHKLVNGKSVLINLTLFKAQGFSTGLLMVAFYFMMHTSYLLISTIYMQKGLQLSALQTGIYFLWFGVSFTVASLLSIKLVTAFGKWPVLAGIVLSTTSFILQYILFDVATDRLTIISVLCIGGLGGGLVLPTLLNLTLRNVSANFVGAASGIYNTVQQAASSIGICIIGGLFFSLLQKNNNVILSFHSALYAEIICLLIVAGLIIKIPFQRHIKK